MTRRTRDTYIERWTWDKKKKKYVQDKIVWQTRQTCPVVRVLRREKDPRGSRLWCDRHQALPASPDDESTMRDGRFHYGGRAMIIIGLTLSRSDQRASFRPHEIVWKLNLVVSPSSILPDPRTSTRTRADRVCLSGRTLNGFSFAGVPEQRSKNRSHSLVEK